MKIDKEDEDIKKYNFRPTTNENESLVNLRRNENISIEKRL